VAAAYESRLLALALLAADVMQRVPDGNNAIELALETFRVCGHLPLA